MATSNFYTSKMTTTGKTTEASSGKEKKTKTTKSSGSKKTVKKSVSEEETDTEETKDDSTEETPKDNEEDKKTAETVDDGSEGTEEDGAEEKTDGEKQEEITDPILGFLNKTGTKVTVDKVDTCPSGLDDGNENKDKIEITIENENGKIKCTLWDEVSDSVPDSKSAFKMIISTLKSGSDVSDVGEFGEKFGFSKVEEARATKAFDGLKKSLGNMQKMFSEEDLASLDELM